MLKNTLLTKTEILAPKKYIKPILSGVGFGICVSLVLLLLFSLIVSSINVPQKLIGALSFISFVFGTWVSGFVSARLVRKNGLVIGMITGAVILLIMLLLGIFVIVEPFSIMLLFKGVAALLSAAFGGILGVNFKHRR